MRSKMLIAFAWQVFASAFAHGQARQGMAYQDYAQIFPRADYIRATPAAGNTPAWEAWRVARDEDPAELAGYLFLIPVFDGGTERSLLIGVTQKLVIAGMKLDGKIELHEEFVSQFAGKRLNAKFEIAKTQTCCTFLQKSGHRKVRPGFLKVSSRQ
jgi:hypothetical protein